MNILKQYWGNYNQQEVYLLTMSNGNMDVAVTNFGCTIVSILFPDDIGSKRNVVLGYDNLANYISDTFYMGCIVGRFSNRISNASYTFENKKYHLCANEKGTANHLHGGEHGFNKKVFFIKDIKYQQDACAIEFFYKSEDREEGYPGNLDMTVTYTLSVSNELTIDYKAVTDYPTPVNLTNHSYFNLSGNPVSAMDHELFVQSDYVLVTNKMYIPTGKVKIVRDTGFDFNKWRSFQDGLKSALASGYNEYFVFNSADDSIPFKAALRHPSSGISMTVATNYPGMMLYTADFLSTPFIPQQGICMETHLYPDSPNRPEFPQAFLKPNETYHYFTTYKFYNFLIN